MFCFRWLLFLLSNCPAMWITSPAWLTNPSLSVPSSVLLPLQGALISYLRNNSTIHPSVTFMCNLCRPSYKSVSAVFWVPLPSPSQDLTAIVTLPAVLYLCIFVLSFLKKFRLSCGSHDRQNYKMEIPDLWYMYMPSPSCTIMNLTPAVKNFTCEIKLVN